MLTKIITILLICYTINGGITHNEDSDIEERFYHHKMKHFVHRRCNLHGQSDKIEEIERESEIVNMCVSKQFSHYALIDDKEKLQKQCYEDRKDVIKCFERFMDIIFPCLPPEENYVPEFLLEAYEGYSEYLCEHIDVLTFTGLLETNMIKCLYIFKHHKEYNPQYVCYDSTKFANHTDGTIITKEDLCQDFDLIEECYDEQFKEHCPQAPEAWEFQKGLLEGMKAPCKHEEEK